MFLEMLQEGTAGAVDKALGNSRGSGRVHDIERMRKWKLSKIDAEVLRDDSNDVERTSLDDLDVSDLDTIRKLEEKGVRVVFPNLKYRKPKYKNVESILNYVESNEDDKAGVKLVIMNFND